MDRLSKGYTQKTEDCLLDIRTSGIFHIDIQGRVWTKKIPRQYNLSKTYDDRWIIATYPQGSYLGFSWKNTSICAHVLVYRWLNGQIPLGWEIDHLDNDTYNNHPLNLEAVTISENQYRKWKRRPELREQHRDLFINRKFSEETIENMKKAQQLKEQEFILHASAEEIENRINKMKAMNLLANSRLTKEDMEAKCSMMRKAYLENSTEEQRRNRALKGWLTRRSNSK